MKTAFNCLQGQVAVAALAAAVCASAPLIVAIRYGIGAAGAWSGGVAIGYFALVACFVPILAAIGKLLYVACRQTLIALSVGRLNRLPSHVLSNSRLGFIATVVAGVVITQAVAQIGRWFFVPAPPYTHLTEDWCAMGGAVAIHVFSAPVLESLILGWLLKRFRSRVSSGLLISISAVAFGLLHLIEHPFWFFPSAVLFGYCAAVYLHEVHAGRTRRAFLLIAASHVLNNAVGFLLIFAQQGLTSW